MSKKKLLIVDDHKDVLEALNLLLSDKYDLSLALSGESAVELIKKKQFDLAIVDLKMEGMSGLEVLDKIMELSPSTKVIILTAHGTIELAVTALKKGASDFIEKPFQVDKLLVTIENILKMKDLEEKEKIQKYRLNLEAKELNFITENKELKKLLKQINTVASKASNILIKGESGTGKELLAKLVHVKSNRSEYPFVKVNSVLLGPDKFESTLFGDKRNPGLLDYADKGTVFFKHINRLPYESQLKLLDFLKNDMTYFLSNGVVKKYDLKVIVSTTENFSELVEAGKFVEELYYLLNILEFEIPPLRSRREDIMPIANYFLDKYSKEINKTFKGFTIEVERIFMKYDWPGNVRELENVVERLVLMTNRVNVGSKFLPPGMKYNKRSPEVVLKLYTEKMEEAEEALIRYTLDKYNGNIMKAANAMGITRATLYNKLKRYKLEK